MKQQDLVSIRLSKNGAEHSVAVLSLGEGVSGFIRACDLEKYWYGLRVLPPVVVLKPEEYELLGVVGTTNNVPDASMYRNVPLLLTDNG